MKPQKKAEGVYVIRWLENGRNGTYRQETLREVTFAEARAVLKQRHSEASRNRGRTYRKQSFGTLATRYLEVHGPNLAPRWLRGVRSYLDLHVLPVFGTRTLDTLRAVEIEEYRNKRKAEGAANGSVNREVTVVFSILNFAERNELIERNPIPRGRVRPLPEEPRTAYFTPEEWERFSSIFEDAAAWERHRKNVRRLGPVILNSETGSERRHGGGLRPEGEASHEYRQRLRKAMEVFRGVLLTGSRVGEMVGLTWDAVDFDRGLLTVFQPKTKRTKTLPLSAELRDLLLAQPRGIGKAPVFQRASGGTWDQARLERVFRLAKKLSGVRPELTIHSLRHTAASWLTIEGTPERFVRDFLGHKDGAMTARYSHLTAEHLRGAADTLGRLSRPVEKAER